MCMVMVVCRVTVVEGRRSNDLAGGLVGHVRGTDLEKRVWGDNLAGLGGTHVEEANK